MVVTHEEGMNVKLPGDDMLEKLFGGEGCQCPIEGEQE